MRSGMTPFSTIQLVASFQGNPGFIPSFPGYRTSNPCPNVELPLQLASALVVSNAWHRALPGEPRRVLGKLADANPGLMGGGSP